MFVGGWSWRDISRAMWIFWLCEAKMSDEHFKCASNCPFGGHQPNRSAHMVAAQPLSADNACQPIAATID